MTLLETLVKASASDALNTKKPSPRVPVVLDAARIFPKLRPETDEPTGEASLPIRRFTGWQIPKYAADAAREVDNILEKLKKMLKDRPKHSTRSKVVQLLDSLLPETLGSLLPGGEAVQLVTQACVSFEIWEKLEALISSDLVGHWDGFDLVGRLAEKNKADLLCLCARQVSDLRSSQLLLMLKYFLSPSERSLSGMSVVRKAWVKQGLLSIKMATNESLVEKLMALARHRSILLMVAYDGFTSYELCLHHLFCSKHLEGLAMSMAVSELDGTELLRLIRYLRKWLEKYDRYPEVTSCYLAPELLRLEAVEWVPSLDSVARGLSLVIDERFSYLILNPQYQEEILSMEKLVKSLASKANCCRYLSNVIQKLPSTEL